MVSAGRPGEDAVAGDLVQKGLFAAVSQLHGRRVAGEANGANGEALMTAGRLKNSSLDYTC